MQDLVVVQPLSVPMSTAEVALFDERDELDLLPLCNTIADLLAQSSPGKDTILVVDDLGKLLDLGAEADDVMRFVRALRVLTRKVGPILTANVAGLTPRHPDPRHPRHPPTHRRARPPRPILDHRRTRSMAASIAPPRGPRPRRRRMVVARRRARERTQRGRHGRGGWPVAFALCAPQNANTKSRTQISSHPLLPPPVSESARNRDAADEQAAPAFGTLVPTAHPLQYRLSETGIEVFAKGTGRGFL